MLAWRAPEILWTLVGERSVGSFGSLSVSPSGKKRDSSLVGEEGGREGPDKGRSPGGGSAAAVTRPGGASEAGWLPALLLAPALASPEAPPKGADVLPEALAALEAEGWLFFRSCLALAATASFCFWTLLLLAFLCPGILKRD